MQAVDHLHRSYFICGRSCWFGAIHAFIRQLIVSDQRTSVIQRIVLFDLAVQAQAERFHLVYVNIGQDGDEFITTTRVTKSSSRNTLVRMPVAPLIAR